MAKRTASAIKSVRQSAKRRITNRQKKQKVKKLLKDLRSTKGKDEFLKSLPKFQKIVDKAAQKGIIHKKTAARMKSRLVKYQQKSKV